MIESLVLFVSVVASVLIGFSLGITHSKYKATNESEHTALVNESMAHAGSMGQGTDITLGKMTIYQGAEGYVSNQKGETIGTVEGYKPSENGNGHTLTNLKGQYSPSISKSKNVADFGDEKVNLDGAYQIKVKGGSLNVDHGPSELEAKGDINVRNSSKVSASSAEGNVTYTKSSGSNISAPNGRVTVEDRSVVSRVAAPYIHIKNRSVVGHAMDADLEKSNNDLGYVPLENKKGSVINVSGGSQIATARQMNKGVINVEKGSVVNLVSTSNNPASGMACYGTTAQNAASIEEAKEMHESERFQPRMTHKDENPNIRQFEEIKYTGSGDITLIGPSTDTAREINHSKREKEWLAKK